MASKWIKIKDVKGFLYFVERFLREFLECRVRKDIDYSYQFEGKFVNDLEMPLKLIIKINNIDLPPHCGIDISHSCNTLRDCFNAYFDYKLQNVIKFTVEWEADKLRFLKDYFEVEFIES